MAAEKGPHSKHLPLSKKTAGASRRLTPGPCCGGRGQDLLGFEARQPSPTISHTIFGLRKAPNRVSQMAFLHRFLCPWVF